jgi:uncharacterized protein
MLHPHTELRFINDRIGYGVVATRLIPRGTITWVRDDLDRALSAAQVERMAPIYHDIVAKYCFVDARGTLSSAGTWPAISTTRVIPPVGARATILN